jgi:alpha-ketoglutarate-dependent taurine dioxygenase
LKDNLNDEDTILLKNEFQKFLEEFITGGKISDIHKNWKRGDCVIFNDHLIMHERSSFHGNRHLKDLAFFNRKLNLYI